MTSKAIKTRIKAEIEGSEEIHDCTISGIDLAIHMITRDNRPFDIELIREAIIEMDEDRFNNDKQK